MFQKIILSLLLISNAIVSSVSVDLTAVDKKILETHQDTKFLYLDNSLRSILKSVADSSEKISDDLATLCDIAKSKSDIHIASLESITNLLQDFTEQNKTIPTKLKTEIEDYFKLLEAVNTETTRKVKVFKNPVRFTQSVAVNQGVNIGGDTHIMNSNLTVDNNINAAGTATFNNLIIDGSSPANFNSSVTFNDQIYIPNMTAVNDDVSEVDNYNSVYLNKTTGQLIQNTSVPIGDGDVHGPTSSCEAQMAVYSNRSGKNIKTTPVTIDTNGNTQIPGTLNVNGNATFYADKTTFNMNVDIGNNLNVINATALNTLNVSGAATFLSGLSSLKTSTFGNINVTGNSLLGSNLNVSGNTTLAGATTLNTLNVSEAATFLSGLNSLRTSTFGNINVTGNSLLGGNLNVSGNTTLAGATTLNTLNVSEAATFLSGLSSLVTSTFGDINVTGATTLNTLNVSGAATFLSGLNSLGTSTFGNINVNGPTTLRNGATISGSSLNVDGTIITASLTAQSLNVDQNTILSGPTTTQGINAQNVHAQSLNVVFDTILSGSLKLPSLDHIAGTPLVASENGIIGLEASSKRYKNSINSINNDDISKVDQLRPVEFYYNEDKQQKDLRFGLIAEEVLQDAELDKLVIYNKNGQVESVKYHMLPSLILARLQQLIKDHNDLQERVTKTEETLNNVEALEKRIQNLKRALQK